MPYRAPTGEFEFIFQNLINLAQVSQTEKFAETDGDTVSAILTEAGRMSEEGL
jgi:hypothetical protein